MSFEFTDSFLTHDYRYTVYRRPADSSCIRPAMNQILSYPTRMISLASSLVNRPSSYGGGMGGGGLGGGVLRISDKDLSATGSVGQGMLRPTDRLKPTTIFR